MILTYIKSPKNFNSVVNKKIDIIKMSYLFEKFLYSIADKNFIN